MQFPLSVPLALLVVVFSGPSITADPLFEKSTLFEGRKGGYHHYRIPGIVVTPKGTLLAYCEARKDRGGDWGTIDVFLRRSTDGGKTWSKREKLVTPPPDVRPNPLAAKQKLTGENRVTVNNPLAIVDEKTGDVHFLYCIEYERCFHIRSGDDGKTWSKPVEITGAFEAFRKDYDWKVLAVGPGHGIQLHNGRLVVPVWLSDGTGGHAHRPSVVAGIVSDDRGKTWKRGEIVVRHPEPKNPSETLALQLADGRVMFNIRHESPNHRRGVSISPDGATGWTKTVYHEQLPEPVCMASLARLSRTKDAKCLGGVVAGTNRILFANPSPDDPGSRKRVDVTVRLSDDEGKTWPVSRLIQKGSSGYSDVAVGPDGVIFLFYERQGSLVLARFNLEWLTNGKDSLKVNAPRR